VEKNKNTAIILAQSDLCYSYTSWQQARGQPWRTKMLSWSLFSLPLTSNIISVEPANLTKHLPPTPPTSITPLVAYFLFGQLALYIVDMTPSMTWPDFTTAVSDL
jgi:hypothetical protein